MRKNQQGDGEGAAIWGAGKLISSPIYWSIRLRKGRFTKGLRPRVLDSVGSGFKSPSHSKYKMSLHFIYATGTSIGPGGYLFSNHWLHITVHWACIEWQGSLWERIKQRPWPQGAQSPEGRSSPRSRWLSMTSQHDKFLNESMSHALREQRRRD